MMNRWKLLRVMLLSAAIVIFIVILMQPISILRFRDEISVLFPKGIIALEQRNLLLIIQVIMLLVIIPVYILTFVFSWKYSAIILKEFMIPIWSTMSLQNISGGEFLSS